MTTLFVLKPLSKIVFIDASVLFPSLRLSEETITVQYAGEESVYKYWLQ